MNGYEEAFPKKGYRAQVVSTTVIVYFVGGIDCGTETYNFGTFNIFLLEDCDEPED